MMFSKNLRRGLERLVLFDLALRYKLMFQFLQTTNVDGFEKTAAAALARCQNLLSPLLSYDIPDHPPDDKQSFLLPFGMPISDTQYHPAISVAKPGSRFGLLLVEGSIEF